MMTMATTKIWVKRPGSSATLVAMGRSDMVDDIRDRILQKYANSLGRHFDSPDLLLRILPRNQQPQRFLGPEELIGLVLEESFPGGQTVDDALVIETQPGSEVGPCPVSGASSDPIETEREVALLIGNPEYGPAWPQGIIHARTAPSLQDPDILVPSSVDLQPPLVSSPIVMLATQASVSETMSSVARSRTHPHRDRPERPHNRRTYTLLPPTVAGVSTANPALPTPTGGPTTLPINSPAALRYADDPASNQVVSATGPPQTATVTDPGSPDHSLDAHAPATPSRQATARRKKPKKGIEPVALAGMLDGSVPPINVLIVEDNPINLKLLEAFVKRLKVRWQTAMNGREAVDKWRLGGFHLVLMDIQLPIMNGLDATREIRRLERINSIGIFSSASSSSVADEFDDQPEDADMLKDRFMFKSPVIIVALTASSLLSDRHDALAAGCNDFLTKPVNFVWLEKKVMEWGCMQALVDFDGWRKWKDFSPSLKEGERRRR